MTRLPSFRTQLIGRPACLISEEVRHILNTLDAACFPEDELYPKDDCYWWSVSTTRGPVAFAGLKLLTGHNEGMGFLCRAGVTPEARGRGLQRRLIATRVRYAQRLNLREVVTYTSPDNFKSAANLLRSGFHLYHPIEQWGIDGALYFRKELSK